MALTYKQALENFKKAEQELQNARKSEIEKIVAEIKDKITEYSLTAEDLGFKAAMKKPAAKKADGKYANPSNPSDTWNGKGRKPGWAVAHLATGGNLEDLLIQK